MRHWHIQWWDALQGGREPLEGVFSHHTCTCTCSLPPEYASKTLEGQRALLICCDHEYIEWTNDDCFQTWILHAQLIHFQFCIHVCAFTMMILCRQKLGFPRHGQSQVKKIFCFYIWYDHRVHGVYVERWFSALIYSELNSPHSVVTRIWSVTRDQKVPGSNPVWVGCCGVDIYQWCLTGLTKAWWCA